MSPSLESKPRVQASSQTTIKLNKTAAYESSTEARALNDSQSFQRYIRCRLFRAFLGVTTVAGVRFTRYLHGAREHAVFSITGINRHNKLGFLAVFL